MVRGRSRAICSGMKGRAALALALTVLPLVPCDGEGTESQVMMSRTGRGGVQGSSLSLAKVYAEAEACGGGNKGLSQAPFGYDEETWRSFRRYWSVKKTHDGREYGLLVVPDDFESLHLAVWLPQRDDELGRQLLQMHGQCQALRVLRLAEPGRTLGDVYLEQIGIDYQVLFNELRDAVSMFESLDGELRVEGKVFVSEGHGALYAAVMPHAQIAEQLAEHGEKLRERMRGPFLRLASRIYLNKLLKKRTMDDLPLADDVRQMKAELLDAAGGMLRRAENRGVVEVAILRYALLRVVLSQAGALSLDAAEKGEIERELGEAREALGPWIERFPEALKEWIGWR